MSVDSGAASDCARGLGLYIAGVETTRNGLLRRVSLLVGLFLLLYFGVLAWQFTPWHKERLYRNLSSADHPTRVRAASELIFLGAEPHLFRALQTDSPTARRLAVQSLWTLWFHEAGDEAFDRLQTALQEEERGNADRALALLTEITREFPTFAEAWNQRATLYWNQGRYGRSIRDCRRALALNPSHFGAWQGMGLCHLRLGQIEEAYRAFQQASALLPRDEDLKALLRHCERLLPPSSRRDRGDLVRAPLFQQRQIRAILPG